ncbi:MAG: DegV family protein [Oscillospiraceae bacterium]|nr:DegV family protein [Oscillospiraceae bacterium]
MVRIISDTSTLYSTTQAAEAGFAVSPLSVTIAGKTYREFDEISSEEFVAIIRQGHMPTSSQPAIGAVTELYESYPGEEVMNICMADGLSGTYNSAVSAARMCENSNRLTVINSRTLCGPHRYMVEKAVELAKGGASVKEIHAWLEKKIDSAKSFLVPADFDYLRRGGRLSPLVSYVGKAANLTPIMTQTEDGCRLTIAGIRRGFPHAVKFIAEQLKKHGIGEGWRVYISHAGTLANAELALKKLKAEMPGAIYEILPLSPAFITQGGPECVAIQYVEA